MNKYRVIEVDYPYKGFFAERRIFWIWLPLHISSRTTKEECYTIIKQHKKINNEN